MSDVKKTRCIICGELFPSEMVSLKQQGAVKPYDMIQKEVCDFCTCKGIRTPYPRKAIPRRYPDAPTENYLALAGAIERGILENYRRLYEDALMANRKMDCICSEEEIAFLRMHRSLLGSPYHAALTLGNVGDLLNYARRDVQEKFPEFHDKDGLALIEERYDWYCKMQEHTKAAAKTF